MGKPSGGRGKGGKGGKKNAGVGVDFRKVKHKVGKKLPRAQNQTDTSFKSHAISLAEQSMAVDREGQAVTGRNLTLKELLGQCPHYAERVRRDALAGLAELLKAHPEELRRHTTLVMETAAERITDGDASVRAALRDLLSSTLLPALGAGPLAPFVPLLMAHVCAAMTHLSDPIRADALGFLELLMGARPDLVASGFLVPVLQHFGDLLSKGSRGRSIKAGSLASLHGVAVALERFLATAMAALAGGHGSCSAAAADALEQQQEQQQHGVLAWQRCLWPPASAPQQGLAAAAAEGSGGASGNAAGAGGSPDAGTAAAAALLGHLLDCWSEAGPSQLAESPELVAAQSLTAILRSCEQLLAHWGPALLAGSAGDRGSLAASILKRVSPFFPVHRPAVRPPPVVSVQLVQLNVAAARLLAHFLPQVATAAGGGGGPSCAAAGGSSGSSWEQPWVGRLLDWFAGVMAEGGALPASDEAMFEDAPEAPPGGGGGASKRRRGAGGGSGTGCSPSATLPAEVYQSALDGAFLVLPMLPPARRQQLLGAAWQLWQRTSARSGSRARVLAFWQALLVDPAAAFYAPTPGGGPLLQPADAATWLASLPRFLFELGGGNPAASVAALRLLLGAARCAPAGSPLAAALQEVQPQLAPLFALLLPPGGKQAAAAGARVHVGPLGALPPAVQELAVDLLYHFPAASKQVLQAAAVVCLHSDAYPASTAIRLLDALGAKAAAGGADPADFGSLLLNVLSGTSRAGLQQQCWRRHEALVGAACRAALQLGDPLTVGASLLPQLLECAQGRAPSSSGSGQVSGWAAYGLLQLCAVLAGAAAAAQQAWQPPAEIAGALPLLMLRLLASSQPAAAEGSGGSAQALGTAEAAALCLRLVSLQPQALLPALLAAVPSSLQAPPDAASPPLPAALALLAMLLREQTVREALLEQQAAVQAALDACRTASAVVGSASQAGREWQDQLRHLEATCIAVLGSGSA